MTGHAASPGATGPRPTVAFVAPLLPGSSRLVIDVDSTICEVAGKAKQGAAFGYTKVFGYHPLLATRADTR